jgi:lipoprotein-releasing system permease protein
VYRFFLSVRYFRTRLVNWLSVAGVMVGVAVMIVVWSVMAGFQAKVRDVLRGTLSHLVMRPSGTQPVPPYAAVDLELRKDPEIVATAPHVTAYVAHPYRTGATQETAATAFHLMEAEGIDWERERKVSSLPSYVKAQSHPASPFKNEEAEWREKKTGMFSAAFLEHFLGRRATPAEWLGTEVDVALLRETDGRNGDADFKRSNYKVVVSAVYDAEDQQSDMQRVYFDRETLREMASVRPEYMEVRAALADYGAAPGVKRRLLGRLAGFEVQTWEEVKAGFLKAVNNEKVLLMIVLSFIVLLSSFTILATLTLTVVEKTRDIGVVKALGGTTGGTLSIFLLSGLLIGALGGALGLALGLFLTRNLNPVKDALRDHFGVDIFPSDIYLFREIPTRLEWPAIAGIVAGSMGLAFLAGLIPALRAARMDPVVALRHE